MDGTRPSPIITLTQVLLYQESAPELRHERKSCPQKLPFLSISHVWLEDNAQQRLHPDAPSFISFRVRRFVPLFTSRSSLHSTFHCTHSNSPLISTLLTFSRHGHNNRGFQSLRSQTLNPCSRL